MAKSKNYKILAMALCASVMAGIYASPVMAADIKVEKGSTLKGVEPSGSTDYTITSGTLKLDGTDIANALNGKNINLGAGSLIINDQNIGNSVAAIRRVVNKDTLMSATYLEETVKAHSAFGLQVLDENGEAVATISRGGSGTFNGMVTTQDVNSNAHSVLSSAGLQLYNSDGTNKVNITNSGVSRFGSFDETNVRIEGGALKIMAPNNEPDAAVSGPLVAQLSEDGLTLVDAGSKYSTLTAAQLANLNSTIKTGGVVDAKELNVKGQYGSFHVKDVTNSDSASNTMIYTENSAGDDTLYIDTQTGNLVTKGALNAGDGAFIANETGVSVGEKFSVSAENGGVQAVEYKINDANVFNAAGLKTSKVTSTGDFITLDDKGNEKYTLNSIGENTAGIERESGVDFVGRPLDTTTIEGKTTIDSRGILNTDTVIATTGQFGHVIVTDNSLNNVGFINGAKVSGSNGALTISGVELNNGLVDNVDVSELSSAATDIRGLVNKTAGISKTGPITTVEDVAFTQGHMDADYVLTDGLKVNGISELDELTVNGLSNLDGVRVHNGSIYAENDSYVGGVQLADGLVNGVDMDNLRAIEGGDYGNGAHYTTIEGVTTFDKDGMGVYTDTGASVIGGGRATFNDGESTTSIIGGAITAKTLNDKVIDDLVEGSDIADDLANIAGISRQQDENGVFYTNIEGTLTVSEKGLKAEKNGHAIDVNKDGAFLSSGTAAVYASNNTVGLMADANNYISITNNGIGLKGNVVFDTENYGPYSLSGLVDKVEDIYNRTQGIDYDSSTGTTTIDGNLDVKGDTETGAGGNENVNGSLTVGYTEGSQTIIEDDNITTGIVDANEGNFTDKVTVGEAGDQTDIDGGTINTGNTTIDGSGMTVGNGTTITDGKVSSTEGDFGNITSKTGTIGNATFDENGMTVGGSDGVSIKDDGITVGGEGGTVISGSDVVINEGTDSEVSLKDTADRVGNLEQGVSELNNRVGELEDRIDKVGAMAAAIANLRTMGYDPAAPTEVAVGIGQYRDETGAALGLFHYPNRDFMLSLSVSTSGDEVMGGIGATWKFGRKSPEKVAEIKKAQAEADARRAEEAKLAKAEEMKQAAKEAKIKAQQERHAKLAAERAAQAEAAK